MKEVSRVRISHSMVRVTTSYSRQEAYEELVWLIANDATDDVLRKMWQLIRPNAVVLPPAVEDSESFLVEQDVIDPVERPTRHEHGH